jgi:hypothetical protein
MNCCCSYGAAVSGEWPEFGCFACPIHKAGLAQVDELCKRHTREKNANGTIHTADGRTLNYVPVWTADDEAQAKGRILRPTEAEVWAERILTSPVLTSIMIDVASLHRARTEKPIVWQTDYKKEN